MLSSLTNQYRVACCPRVPVPFTAHGTLVYPRTGSVRGVVNADLDLVFFAFGFGLLCTPSDMTTMPLLSATLWAIAISAITILLNVLIRRSRRDFL